MTAEERIQFAIRFAEMKLDENRSGDWMNLRDDLNHFLGAGADDEINVPLSRTTYICARPFTEGISGRKASADDYRDIQDGVVELLSSFAGGPVRKKKPPIDRGHKGVPINLTYD